MNFEGTLCVCCMSTNDLLDLFHPCITDEGEEIYSEMLAYTLNVKFKENENASICPTCIDELRQAYKFAQKTYSILAILDSKKVPAHFKRLKCKEEYLEDDGDYYEPPKRTKRSRKVRGRRPKYAITAVPVKNCKVPKVLDTDRVCTECGESFPCAKSLRSHQNSHFPRFACDLCERKFATRVRLNSHMRSHRNGPFECDVCGVQKENLNTLESHKRMKHSVSKVFPCEICGVECKGYITRRRHLYKEHGVDTYSYQCEICPKKFIASAHLSRHYNSVHLNLCNFQCEYCERRFKDKLVLKHHLEHAHNIGEKKYQCQHCLKRFSRKYTLTNHLLIHTNERNFVCPLCESAFIYKCVLKTHIEMHAKREEITSEVVEYLMKTADIKYTPNETFKVEPDLQEEPIERRLPKIAAPRVYLPARKRFAKDEPTSQVLANGGIPGKLEAMETVSLEELVQEGEYEVSAQHEVEVPVIINVRGGIAMVETLN